ncbi:MAG: hypothetical protein C0393_05435 [Anaerolinea sp.]|nr:hypothetical protein [Anaerolinea sp.]
MFFKSPGLGERRAGREGGAIRHGDVGDELRPVTARHRGGRLRAKDGRRHELRQDGQNQDNWDDHTS